jgi:hypothetical protein
MIDSQATTSFIEAYVAEADRTGDIQTDVKKALIAALELTHGGYTLDDLWKRYQLSDIVTGDPDVEGPPSQVPPGFGGNHPRHFLPPDRIKNPDNTNGFPTGGAYPDLQLPDAYDSASVTTELTDYVTNVPMSTTAAMGQFYNDGLNSLMCDHLTDQVKVITYSTAYDASTASYGATDSEEWDDAYNVVLDAAWFNDDGTKLFYVDNFRDDVVENTTGTPYDLSDTGMGTHTAVDFTSANLTAVWNGFMNSDGTKLYVIGSGAGGELIEEYSLSTAWDITSASQVGVSPALTSRAECAVLNGAGNKIVWFDSGRVLRSISGSGTIDNWTVDAETLTLTAVIPSTAGGTLNVDADGSLIIWCDDNNIYKVPLL